MSHNLEPIPYRGWLILPGDPVRIQPPGRDPLPGGYGTLGHAKQAVSTALRHAQRASNPVVPETEAVIKYRGWLIHVARNPRRYTSPDWLRIQAPGEPIRPDRYRKLQYAKHAIIAAQHYEQKHAGSNPNGTIDDAELEEPLG